MIGISFQQQVHKYEEEIIKDWSIPVTKNPDISNGVL